MLPPKLGELVKLLSIVVEVGVISEEVVTSSSSNLTIVSAFSIGMVWLKEEVWVFLFSLKMSPAMSLILNNHLVISSLYLIRHWLKVLTVGSDERESKIDWMTLLNLFQFKKSFCAVAWFSLLCSILAHAYVLCDALLKQVKVILIVSWKSRYFVVPWEPVQSLL